MVQRKDPDELANLWNKTKDPKYKKLWYKLIEEMHGIDNFKRRSVSTNSSNKTNVRWNSVDKQR
jgi:hypothetical protein